MQPRGIWGISRDFSRLSPCGGQVAYALLTRAPVAGRSVAAPPLPLDLHVLSLPLAFILSQDQTLRCCYMFFHFLSAPPPDTGMEGAGAVPGRIDKGKPKKGAFPRSSLFYSSRRMMSMCQARSRKRGRDCKVSKKEAPVQLPRGIFSGRARKKAPSAVCGCKGTARNTFFPNFIPTFFEKNYKLS